LKDYAPNEQQMGAIGDYERFLEELDRVWAECLRVLAPGGRICCVVGDVCVPRKKSGRHLVMPLHADIQVRSRNLGLDCLTPILWHKIANGVTEAEGNGAGFYGNPYQPGAVVKNDIEYVLFMRKGGTYRSPTVTQKTLSMLTKDEMQSWWRSIWTDIKGASTRRGHPAPFPVELAERLIRMFSFAGDVILDPFTGTGSTNIAALNAGRNSIGNEIEEAYLSIAHHRMLEAASEVRTVGAVRSSVKLDAAPERISAKANGIVLSVAQRFRELFDGVKYRHRDSTLGDSVAAFLPEDLYALDRSKRLRERIDSKRVVVNRANRTHGVKARRGDGLLGEIVPHVTAVEIPGFVVARGPVATIEIGSEVKILAKAMIKQIDRVMNDLLNQRQEFKKAGGNPVTVGIVGINQAPHYLSFEGERQYPTDGTKYKHPVQEAADAERRLVDNVQASFDEFVILRFRATNQPPHVFHWTNESQTELDYGAVLTRILRKYEVRFP
jgi:modification methylase